MKRILCLLACLILFSSGCSLNKMPELPPAQDGKPHQVILIKQTGASTATLDWYSAKGKLRMSCPAFIGKNGMGKEKEGDGKTPLGEYAILCSFGIQKNPRTKLKYIEATESLYLCGEKENYNRFINDPKMRHRHECEQIVAYKGQYNYGIFLDYNKDCVYRKGFAIFIQCKGITPYTAGSIAIEEDNMVKLLRGLEPTARVIIQR